MKKLAMVLALLVGARTAVAQNTFTNAPIANLPGVEILSSVAWGDYDNDGHLDFLLTGYDLSMVQAVSQVWRNTGSGFSNVTSQVALGLPQVYAGSVAWGDFDNDGRLDFVLTGDTLVGSSHIAQLWRNTGNGFSNVTGQMAAGLPGLDSSSVAWGDYDNDGRLDLLITGTSSSGRTSQLWRNTGSGFSNVTSQVAPGLPRVYASSVAWGDYDNDGRLDFIITGNSTGSNLISQVWRNTGNGFSNVTSEVAPGLPGVWYGSVAWGDYDNDGRLDFVLTGSADANFNSSGLISQIWRNTGNGFSNVTSQIAPRLPGVDFSSVAWGDYDNDGRLDLLLAGSTNGYNLGATLQLWRNTGNGFSNVTSEVAPGLPGAFSGSVAWGDYDNDGRLDFLLDGFSGSVPVSQLWRNSSGQTNTPPTVPTGLSARINSRNSVTLRWNPASDAQTPSSGLTYNLVLGTSPNAVDVASPLADVASGFRRVARLGAVNAGTDGTLAYTFTNLPSAPQYFWSVQALDTAFAGGPFAPAQVIVFDPPTLTCSGTNLPNDPGQCGASVSNYNLSVGGGLASVVCEPPAGTPLPLGDTTVNCTASNTAGSATCAFTVTVLDEEAPRVAVRPAPNPSGRNVPVPEKNPNAGQNPDGFYELLGRDNCDPAVSIYVADSASTFVTGPFADGDIVKITQAASPGSKPMGGGVVSHIFVRGDALVYAVDADGNTSLPFQVSL